MKVLGTANPADLMTKYLTREKVDNAIDKMGQVVQQGRADSSLDIQGTIKGIQGVERRKQSGTIGVVLAPLRWRQIAVGRAEKRLFESTHNHAVHYSQSLLKMRSTRAWAR